VAENRPEEISRILRLGESCTPEYIRDSSKTPSQYIFRETFLVRPASGTGLDRLAVEIKSPSCLGAIRQRCVATFDGP